MPRVAGPAYQRMILMQHVSEFINAGTVSPDFNANTLQTIAGGTAGFIPGFKCELEKIRFRVGPEDFAGAGGTLTFELRKTSATGQVMGAITIPLASALRGAVVESAITQVEQVKLGDTDKLFLVRLATGTAFTTGRGVFEVWGRQLPQSRQ